MDAKINIMEVDVNDHFLYSDEWGYGSSLITIVIKFDDTPTISDLKRAIRAKGH